MLSSLLGLLSGEGNSQQILINVFVLAFVTLFCLPVHESAHAWAASKLGDNTGRLQGRISLNPFNHLSLMGTVMLFLFGFGYAKPVPVSIRNFKDQKLYFALTSLAGPFANIILAVIFSVLAHIIGFFMSSFYIGAVAFRFIYLIAYYNIVLAVFNLIPIPPLDGSRLVTAVLPDSVYYKLLEFERYSMFILFGLIFIFNRLNFSPLSIVSGKAFDFIFRITSLPFKFFETLVQLLCRL